MKHKIIILLAFLFSFSSKAQIHPIPGILPAPAEKYMLTSVDTLSDYRFNYDSIYFSLSNDSLYLNSSISVDLSIYNNTSYWTQSGSDIYYTTGKVQAQSNYITDGGVTYNLSISNTSTSFDNIDPAAVGNIGIGSNVFESLTDGIGNVGIGHAALRYTTGQYNVGIGYNALISNTTGANNFAAGGFALDANTTGDHNFALGYNCLTNSTNDQNVGIGQSSLKTLTSGQRNTGVGAKSLENATGSYNAAIAYLAGRNVSGSYNTVIGGLTDGVLVNYNTVIGYEAAGAATSGSNNVIMGRNAGLTNAGDDNIFLGYQAGYHETGDDKLYITNQKGSSLSNGWGKAIIAGDMTSTTANQNLYFNAELFLSQYGSARASDGDPTLLLTTTGTEGTVQVSDIEDLNDAIDTETQITPLMGWNWDGTRIWRNSGGLSVGTSSLISGSMLSINGGNVAFTTTGDGINLHNGIGNYDAVVSNSKILDIGTAANWDTIQLNTATAITDSDGLRIATGTHNGIALRKTTTGAGLEIGGTSWNRLYTTNATIIGGGTLDGSAILQANSTTQGFLPPTMTTTQRNAISSPAAGLIIYNTSTNKHQGYDGTSWNDFY